MLWEGKTPSTEHRGDDHHNVIEHRLTVTVFIVKQTQHQL